MPRKREKELIIGQFFRWLVGTRAGVYCADGRSNKTDLGRHSLGTRGREEALERIRQLDTRMAIQFGLVDASVLGKTDDPLLSLEDGQEQYLKFVTRPAVQGGTRPATYKHYRAVIAKFVEFAKRNGTDIGNKSTSGC